MQNPMRMVKYALQAMGISERNTQPMGTVNRLPPLTFNTIQFLQLDISNGDGALGPKNESGDEASPLEDAQQ